jgi:hypothetical protein
MQVTIRERILLSKKDICQAIKLVVNQTKEIKINSEEEIIFSFGGSIFLEIGEKPVIKVWIVFHPYPGIEEIDFESQQQIDSFADLLETKIESVTGYQAIVSVRNYRLAADYCQN